MPYLFIAHFKNGDIIRQNEADICLTNADKNCFWEVLQRIDDVAMFAITNGTDRWQVDLQVGSFVHNGVPFGCCDPRVNLTGATLRLVWFKQHKHTFNSGCEELAHTITYHIGWQATIDGRNIQQTIAVR